MPRSNARRIFVVVLGAVRGNLDPRCAVRRPRRTTRERHTQCRERVATKKANGCLLVRIQRQRRGEVWYRTGHQPAVISPIESHPRPAPALCGRAFSGLGLSCKSGTRSHAQPLTIVEVTSAFTLLQT